MYILKIDSHLSTLSTETLAVVVEQLKQGFKGAQIVVLPHGIDFVAYIPDQPEEK
jgi:hypothetical protein